MRRVVVNRGAVVIALLWLGMPLRAQFTRADSLRGYLYPERSCYDVKYYMIDLAIDWDSQSVALAGAVTMDFDVVDDFTRMQVDLYAGFNVISATWSFRSLKVERDGNALYLDFPEELRAGTRHAVSIVYSGRPQMARNAPWDGGFVLSHDVDDQPWIGVACEGDGASLWWPCKDHPSDEPDSVRFIARVPTGLTAVCNGRLEGAYEVEGTTSFVWLVTNPINVYNVTLNIANYAHFGDTIAGAKGPLTLDYYVLQSNLEKARKQFKQVEPMIHCFEAYFGPYPFYEDGYKLVETPYLGMEHQSAIAYGNHYKKGYLGFDPSGKGFDYIIIHESGHEWFGNSITANDMTELWIHEGFTTYSEAIYLECLYGYNVAIDYMNAQRFNISNAEPIVGPRDVAYDHFGDNDMYHKGAWMLQTLRKVVNNDTLWFTMLRDFCRTFYHRITNTEEVIRFFCDRSGMDLRPVFRQYLYSAQQPILDFEFVKKKKGQALLRYRWANVSLDFNMPIEIRYGSQASHWHRLRPTTEWQSIWLTGIDANGFSVNTDEFYVKARRL